MQEFYTLKTYEEAFEKAGILKASICPDNAPDDAVVRLVTFDSREAAEETLFFCKGAHFKADFLTDAVAAGAHCYV